MATSLWGGTDEWRIGLLLLISFHDYINQKENQHYLNASCQETTVKEHNHASLLYVSFS